MSQFIKFNIMCLYTITFKASRSDDESIGALRIDRRFFLASLIFVISTGMSELVVPATLHFNLGSPIASILVF